MTASVCLAACLLRYLDPFTSAYQTDDPAEGAALAAEPGWWPVPCGLEDPVAWKTRARVVHTVFRRCDRPYRAWTPDTESPLFKVNQVGYMPDAPKFAYVGGWLGPEFGAWRPRSPLESWELVDAATGQVAATGSGDAAPRIRVRDGTTKEGTPFTGEETWEIDFSSVRREGEYFLRIPGVGRSAVFRIAASAAEDAFRVHMGGLYQKRCGIAKTEPWTHWTNDVCHRVAVRGTFPPEEGRLEPKVSWFDIISANTDWENGERLVMEGGWHDAADYDRRTSHMNVVNDLCAVYLMRPGNFSDGQLAVPESANGIPDILDEAEWGLRHILAGQQKDGGAGTWVETVGHPPPGNAAWSDGNRYALSRATRRSSLAYAAHAALLARCHPAFRGKYLESARRAWDFALSARPAVEYFEVERRAFRFLTVRDGVYWEEDKSLPWAYLAKAAVNLHALTGDAAYIEALAPHMDEMVRDGSAWSWPPLLFAGERALGLPDGAKPFFDMVKRRVMKGADQILDQIAQSYAYRAPWWAPGQGWVGAMGWGACLPLRRAQWLVAAHGITGDAKYLEAASLALDFHNGCNPSGTTLTSGLGRGYPVAFLDLPSYVDGIAEYTPGITPYRWTYGMPAKAVEMVFGGDRKRAAKWPIWRRWGNVEAKSVAASEFTVWETIAPAASVTGYLLAPSGRPPAPRPPPADDISKLPGYWVLP